MPPGPRVPCPSCGGIPRTTGVILQSETKAVSKVRMRKKDPTLSSKKNPRVDQMVGQELRVSTGEHVQKERRIDREADAYREIVTDAQGNVIHHDEGKLSDHKGHGSDKPKL